MTKKSKYTFEDCFVTIVTESKKIFGVFLNFLTNRQEEEN